MAETDEIVISAEVQANKELGAASLLIHYDPLVLHVTGCELGTGLMGVCNIDYERDGVAPDIISISGIAAEQLSGRVDLATLNVEAHTEGASEIQLETVVVSDRAGATFVANAQDGNANVVTLLSPTNIRLAGNSATPANNSVNSLSTIVLTIVVLMVATLWSWKRGLIKQNG